MAIDFGYTLLAAELVLGYAGYWADHRWHTGPWLMIAGVLLGLAVSFKSLFSALDRAAKADKAMRAAKKQQDNEGGPRSP